MRNRQVAILDVGSSKITACVGERGVNKTFLIKGRKSFDYEGFADGNFFEVEQLKNILSLCADYFFNEIHIPFDCIYVGVPNDFTSVIVKDAQISFKKKKKITEKDVDTLFDSAFASKSDGIIINRSAIRYELNDYRRLANPVGYSSEVLKGKLSFIICSNYFINLFSVALKDAGFRIVEFVSSSLAEAMYLIEPETRDRIAMLLDVGYITTTFSLIQGDGILFQKAFAYGGGYISANISEKFNIEFNEAENIKKELNLIKSNSFNGEIISFENGKSINIQDVIKLTKNCLDTLSEKISDAIDESGFIIPEYVPMFVTGGGISYLRGALSHIYNRLNIPIEKIAPKVPLMDNPSESSLLSLLDMALGQEI